MFEQRYLTEVRSIFQEQKQLAESALNQVSDDDLHRVLAPDTLSLAVIVQHISNNMLSRWTDFLTTDGEKPDRNRDAEFEDQQLSRTELMATWDERWQLLDDVLASLTPDDIGVRPCSSAVKRRASSGRSRSKSPTTAITSARSSTWRRYSPERPGTC